MPNWTDDDGRSHFNDGEPAKRALRAPTVHLNGSSKAMLLAQYRGAVDAIIEARDALQQTRPHGRDYYVQEGNALTEAEEQHLARMTHLNAVMDELKELYENVDEQGARKR